MNADDKEFFWAAMADVKPLKQETQWLKPAAVKSRQQIDNLQLDNPLTTGFLTIIPLAEPLFFRRDGLQSGVLEKLRRGKYTRQMSLNLLRQPVELCRQNVFAFIHQASDEGLRNLLIIHGKGREDNSHANIVRSYLARWLSELDEVQAFCTALPHHGGSGACYVALKKSAQARQENRERHAKHSR